MKTLAWISVAAFCLLAGIAIGYMPKASERDVELRLLLKQSCELYCSDVVEPGLFNLPEVNGLRGHLREGMCVCELRHVDPTPWNQDDQHEQKVQDFWLER